MYYVREELPLVGAFAYCCLLPVIRLPKHSTHLVTGSTNQPWVKAAYPNHHLPVTPAKAHLAIWQWVTRVAQTTDSRVDPKQPQTPD